MDAQQCILTRRSVRQFADRPVSRELLEKVVSLASYAPSWKNTQISRTNSDHSINKIITKYF